MKRTAVVCAGQGTQYVSMGRELVEAYPAAARVFDEANDALGFDLRSLCFSGDLDELTRTDNAQPAILTVSYAMAQALFDDSGIYPAVLAGHSLGEYTALVCSGAMQFADAVRIVRKRGQLMQAAATGPSGMAAVVGSNTAYVEEVCRAVSSPDEVVVISNDNSSKQLVISGHLAALDRATDGLVSDGLFVERLKVSAPFHSPYMKSAAEALAQELAGYTFSDLQVPVIANTTAQPYAGKESIVGNLTAQLSSRVRWTETMAYLESLRISALVEIGPKQVLANLMRSEKPLIRSFAMDIAADREAWADYRVPTLDEVSLIGRCLAVAVCTRNHNFDDEQYRRGVIEPYNEIKALQDFLELEQRLPDRQDSMRALLLLKTILDTKGTPPEEQRSRVVQITQETGTYGSLRTDLQTAGLL